MHPIIPAIRDGLQKASDPQKARQMQAYMKTEQPFYGVQAPERRRLLRAAARIYPITSRRQYNRVILTLWNGKYREEMYQALGVAEWIKAYRDAASFPLYEKLIKTAPNWDTLDWIAGKLVSTLILSNRQLESRLVAWSSSPNMWVRRASLLAHLHHRELTNTDLLAETILKLAPEKAFFIRKAIGWVLRDYSYTDPHWVARFIDRHAQVLSTLSRREALAHIHRKAQKQHGAKPNL